MIWITDCPDRGMLSKKSNFYHVNPTVSTGARKVEAGSQRQGSKTPEKDKGSTQVSTVKPVLSNHIKQNIVLALQTSGCFLLHESGVESSLL